MRWPGLLNLVELAVVLAFALPLLGFGLSFLLDGRAIGVVFVGIATAMLLLRHALGTPFSPENAVEAAVDRVLPDDDR